MAPNKKKKKAVSNPGRGFATTSTPSKSKSTEDADSTVVDDDVFRATGSSDASIYPDKVQAQNSELHDLNSRGSAQQNHDSDLQLLIEKHRGKSRKDASHQANRLFTEKRVLRPQAEQLNTRSWLPDELVQLVQARLEQQVHQSTKLVDTSDSNRAARDVAEDEQLAMIW